MKVSSSFWSKLFKTIAIIAGAVILAMLIDKTRLAMNFLPTIESGASLGLIFVFGLLTSIHCIGMCGGLMLTQCVGEKGDSKIANILGPVLYNLGRVIAYTAVGAAVGAIGHVFSISGFLKGLIPIVGGLFMIMLAINLLGFFPALRHLQFGAPNSLVNKIRRGNFGPFILGVLMGIMPCGPLQTAQLYALSTGSALKGATAMFVFAVGTVPGLLAFGTFGSFMTKKFSNSLMKVSALVIIILGVSMVGRGLTLEGIPNPLWKSASPAMNMTSPSAMPANSNSSNMSGMNTSNTSGHDNDEHDNSMHK